MLEQFVARRKKAKKDNEKKKAGLKLMITDYFLHTKPVIKKEKKEGKLVDPSPTKDVLQDKRYDFNRSAVPEDDDLEILEVVPGKDTDDWKAIPFIYVVSDEDDMEMKSEPAEADSTDVSLVTAKREPDELVAKSEPLSQVQDKELHNNDVTPTFIKEETNEYLELISETISLEGDPAKEDVQEKTWDRENSLLLQIENLSKGLQGMKAQMRREKRAAATWSMVLRVCKKVLKTKPVKKPLKSRFETPPKNESVVSNLNAAVEEQQTDVQWEQVKDNSYAQSKVGKR